MNTSADPRMQFYADRLKHLAHYGSQVELIEDTKDDPKARADHESRIKAIDAVYEEMASVGLIRKPSDDSMAWVWAGMCDVKLASNA